MRRLPDGIPTPWAQPRIWIGIRFAPTRRIAHQSGGLGFESFPVPGQGSRGSLELLAKAIEIPGDKFCFGFQDPPPGASRSRMRFFAGGAGEGGHGRRQGDKAPCGAADRYGPGSGHRVSGRNRAFPSGPRPPRPNRKSRTWARAQVVRAGSRHNGPERGPLRPKGPRERGNEPEKAAWMGGVRIVRL